MRRAVTAIVVAALGTFGAGCERASDASPRQAATSQPGDTSRPITVATVPVTLADRPITVSLTGSLFGDEQATVSAKVGGRIASIAADVGDRVAPNAVLAQIELSDYQIQVDQKRLAVREALASLGLGELPNESFDPSTVATVERARFQRENAQAKLDRASKLMQSEPPAISEQEFADMRTAFEVARRDYDVAVLQTSAQLAMARSRSAEVAAAEQQLADATLRAPAQPADGSPEHFAVAARLVSAGELVNPGTPMFRLVADRLIKFRGAAPERFARQLARGQTATFQIDGAQTVKGEVSRVSPAIDPVSRTFEIEIVIDNSDGQLRPGAFARAQVVVGQQVGVSLVPKNAVISFAGIDRVFIVKDGKATGTRVTPVETMGEKVAIAESLAENTPVILRGDRGIAEGVAVTIGAVPPPSSASSDSD